MSKAYTPRENRKLSWIILNPNAKAKLKRTEKDWDTQLKADSLISQIHSAVTKGKSRPYEVSKSEYGIKYKYRISVKGPNGKTKNVIAVYQIDNGSTKPRLITNYLEGK